MRAVWFRVCLLGSILHVGCALDTDLTDERTRPGGSAGAAGAAPALSTTSDATPPALADIQVAMAAGCLGVTLSADEPVTVEALAHVGETTVTLMLGAGAGSVDLAAPARALPPDADGDVTIRAVDRAGNATVSDPIAIHTPAALPPLAITEVLANPAGKEPDQEFVELHNLGDAAVNVMGMRIEDSRGGDVLPAVEVAAGAYALIVGTGFDAFSVIDVPPRPGAKLIHLDSRIGSDGLSNTGEVLRLRAPGGPDAPVISSYGGWVDVSAKSWAGRSVRRGPEDACDRAESWNRTPLEPTPGW